MEQKLMTLITLASLFVSPAAYCGDDFQAKLHSVEVYEADNSCNNAHLSLSEKYEIINRKLTGIIMARYSSKYGGLSNSGLSIKPMKYKTQEGDFLQFDICITKNYKSDITTRFMSESGELSNTIKHTVNVEELTVKPASAWTSLIKNE